MNPRAVAIFAILTAAIVGISLWFLNSDHAPHQPPAAETTPKPAPTPVPGPVRTTSGNQPVISAPPPAVAKTPAIPQPPAAPVQMTEDDRKIDDILGRFPGNTEADHVNTARALINILPTLSEDGQSEAAQHIVNLLPDTEMKLLMPLWQNPGTNADVIDVIGTDLMNRENNVMLPAMLEALKRPNHPFHDDAQSTLEIFLDEDYGTDFAKWEAAMKKFLKEEADEAADVAPAPAAPGQ